MSGSLNWRQMACLKSWMKGHVRLARLQNATNWAITLLEESLSLNKQTMFAPIHSLRAASHLTRLDLWVAILCYVVLVKYNIVRTGCPSCVKHVHSVDNRQYQYVYYMAIHETSILDNKQQDIIRLDASQKHLNGLTLSKRHIIPQREVVW